MGEPASLRSTTTDHSTKAQATKDREVRPLSSIDEILQYNEPPLCIVEPLNVNVRRGGAQDPKILFCHDMMGGYLDDRFIFGCCTANPYRFHHWQNINTFIYYAHHLVTIPPPGWITAAHRHGVKVLGTFMIEKKEDLVKVTSSEDWERVSAQLAKVSSLGRFDGWLVSFGCDVDASHVTGLKRLLSAITYWTHKEVPGSEVLYYDAVDDRGVSTPHNELDNGNIDYLTICDGFFVNFKWSEAGLQRTAALAGARKTDVYVGIDVFGRETPYPGGYEMFKAVATAHQYGLSAAVFAAGWVYETQDKAEFAENQYRLWKFPDDICPKWRLTAPELSTTFCQGFGNEMRSAGKLCGPAWYNLAKQQLQPKDQGYDLCGGFASLTVCLDDAYNGGGCLRAEVNASSNRPGNTAYFRLFGCEFPLDTLTAAYTFKVSSSSRLAGPDVALVIKARKASGASVEFVLGSTCHKPEGVGSLKRKLTTSQAVPDDRSSEWYTRRYIISDEEVLERSTVEEIGLRVQFAGAGWLVCWLGEMTITGSSDGDALI